MQTSNSIDICFKIGAEVMSCRTTAAVFNLSSFCKILIEGPNAKQALEWICTNDISQPANTYVSICIIYLNLSGKKNQFLQY